MTFRLGKTEVIDLVRDALDAPGATTNTYTGDAGIEAVKNLLASNNELELFG